MKKKGDPITNKRPLDTTEIHRLEKEHQDMRENQIHPPLEARVPEGVPELQEEEEEMNPVILVEMKDQIGMKVQTLK